MDIVTHTMAGMILASPLVTTAPVTATCVVVGSVLPDLDALSRKLRDAGERVIYELPGQSGSPAAMGCDRRIVKRGDEWTVEAAGK